VNRLRAALVAVTWLFVACAGGPQVHDALLEIQRNVWSANVAVLGQVQYFGLDILPRNGLSVVIDKVEVLGLPSSVKTVGVWGEDLSISPGLIGGLSEKELTPEERGALVPLDQVILRAPRPGPRELHASCRIAAHCPWGFRDRGRESALHHCFWRGRLGRSGVGPNIQDQSDGGVARSRRSLARWHFALADRSISRRSSTSLPINKTGRRFGRPACECLVRWSDVRPESGMYDTLWTCFWPTF
jgi:hypothetical protein